MGAPPATQARTFISHTGRQIAVGLLRLSNDVNDGVEIVVEFGIVMDSQRIRGSFDDLVRVGIVEGEVTSMLTLDEPGGNRKVVETTIHLALMEGRRDRDRTIDLYTRRPETVVQVYLGEGHLLNRSLRLRLFGGTGGDGQCGHAYQE